MSDLTTTTKGATDVIETLQNNNKGAAATIAILVAAVGLKALKILSK